MNSILVDIYKIIILDGLVQTLILITMMETVQKAQISPMSSCWHPNRFITQLDQSATGPETILLISQTLLCWDWTIIWRLTWP